MELVKLPDAFSDREFNWAEEAQGLASSPDYWFVTHKPRLGRLPRTGSLAGDYQEHRDIPQFLRDEHYDHFGDLDYADGRVFIPLEGKIFVNPVTYTLRPRLCAFDAETLDFLGWASFPEQATNAPWVAVHPQNKLVYSSHDRPDVILGHQVEVDAFGLTAKVVSKTLLRDENSVQMVPGQVQGGAFTPDGKYLVLSVKNGDNLELQIYDMPSGVRMKRKYISGEGTGGDLENEGLMIVDNSITLLQPKWTIFIIILNNDTFESDNITVQRWEIHPGQAPLINAPPSG